MIESKSPDSEAVGAAAGDGAGGFAAGSAGEGLRGKEGMMEMAVAAVRALNAGGKLRVAGQDKELDIRGIVGECVSRGHLS